MNSGVGEEQKMTDFWGVRPFILFTSASPTSLLDAFLALFSSRGYFKPPDRIRRFLFIVENAHLSMILSYPSRHMT